MIRFLPIIWVKSYYNIEFYEMVDGFFIFAVCAGAGGFMRGFSNESAERIQLAGFVGKPIPAGPGDSERAVRCTKAPDRQPKNN